MRKGGGSESQYGVLSEAIVQEAERYLLEKKLKLTKFSLENADIGAFWVSSNGEFIYANEKICRNLGYDKDELIGMKVSEIDPNYTDERPEIWKNSKKKRV